MYFVLLNVAEIFIELLNNLLNLIEMGDGERCKIVDDK